MRAIELRSMFFQGACLAAHFTALVHIHSKTGIILSQLQSSVCLWTYFCQYSSETMVRDTVIKLQRRVVKIKMKAKSRDESVRLSVQRLLNNVTPADNHKKIH